MRKQKTRTGELNSVKRTMKRLFIENTGTLATLALPVVMAGAYVGGNVAFTKNQVYPMAWYDINQDGYNDAAVICPIEWTDKGIVRWVDGKHLSSKGYQVPAGKKEFTYPNNSPFDISLAETNSAPFQITSDFYNQLYWSSNSYVGERGKEYRERQETIDYLAKYPLSILENKLNSPEANNKGLGLFVRNEWGPSSKIANLE